MTPVAVSVVSVPGRWPYYVARLYGAGRRGQYVPLRGPTGRSEPRRTVEMAARDAAVFAADLNLDILPRRVGGWAGVTIPTAPGGVVVPESGPELSGRWSRRGWRRPPAPVCP